MKRNLIARIAAIIPALMLAPVPGVSKPSVSDFRLTVRLLDYVNLPAAARSEVVATAKRVLGQAGVTVDFVECLTDGVETHSSACTARLRPTVLVLRILQPRAKQPSHQLGYALGTPEEGAYVTVFYDPEQRTAKAAGLDDDVLLGYAVAHEIGHLLLGPSHSSAGIMRQSWRPVDERWMAQGTLSFHPAQARQMRSALAARASRYTERLK